MLELHELKVIFLLSSYLQGTVYGLNISRFSSVTKLKLRM